MFRAVASGNVLSEENVSMVKGMLERGDRQHDIAAFFGVNGGRIGEIASGKKYQDVVALKQDKLPPPGPYLTGLQAVKIARENEKLKEENSVLLKKLNYAEAALNLIHTSTKGWAGKRKSNK